MRSVSHRERKARRDLMIAVFDRIATDCANAPMPAGEIVTSLEAWHNAILIETEIRQNRVKQAMVVYGE